MMSSSIRFAGITHATGTQKQVDTALASFIIKTSATNGHDEGEGVGLDGRDAVDFLKQYYNATIPKGLVSRHALVRYAANHPRDTGKQAAISTANTRLDFILSNAGTPFHFQLLAYYRDASYKNDKKDAAGKPIQEIHHRPHVIV